MKICRIVNNFPSFNQIKGDLAPNYYYYSKLSMKQGNEEIIIAEQNHGQPSYEHIVGLPVIYRIKTNERHKLLSSVSGNFGKKALELVKALEPDIITGHNTAHYYLCSHKNELKAPLITQLHVSIDMYKYADQLPYTYNLKTAIYDRIISRIQHILFKDVTKNCDAVIACDKYSKQSVLEYNPDQQVEVIYNGTDIDIFKSQETNKNPITLLNISRPAPWKGIQYLLQALYELKKTHPTIHLIQIGADRPDSQVYFNWLRNIASKLNISSNITFLKNIPYIELPYYYSYADCFVAPSYPEPSAKTIYEAQSCNCPIVATNGGGTPELFSPESGLLFSPRNLPEIVNSINKILENPSNYKNGRETIKKHATWDICVKKMNEVYEKCLTMDM